MKINSVQTRCIVKGEAQKSPLFWRFSGGFWFSQDRLFSRNSTSKPFNLIKSRFLQTPLVKPLVFTMYLEWGVSQRPLTLILLQKYRDTNGRRIVIQVGGVYTTFCQEEDILFKSIGVRGRFDSPDRMHTVEKILVYWVAVLVFFTESKDKKIMGEVQMGAYGHSLQFVHDRLIVHFCGPLGPFLRELSSQNDVCRQPSTIVDKYLRPPHVDSPEIRAVDREWSRYCRKVCWTKMAQNGANDHFGQNDLIPNRILAFKTTMDQNGPFWPDEVHFAPSRSANCTLAIPEVEIRNRNRKDGAILAHSVLALPHERSVIDVLE